MKLTALIAGALAVGALTFPASALVDASALDNLPVQEGGRKKPYYVFAQETLLGIAGRTDLEIDGTRRNATDVVTSIWLEPEGWDAEPLVLINHLDVKREAGLERSRKLFSHDELASNDAFVALIQRAEAAKRASDGGRLDGIDKLVEEIALRIARYEELRRGDLHRLVANPAGADAPWMTLAPETPPLVALREAMRRGDDTAFAAAAAELAGSLALQAPEFQPSEGIIALETAYKKSHPFRWAWIFYLASGISLAALTGKFARAGYVAGWAFALAGFAAQVAGFAARVVVAGRPPVSNMYESVIWVAFGVVFFALVFEAIYRTRTILLGAVPVAVVSLILADSQPLALDRSIQPLVPVLQSNFWLTTHVLTITLSYAAFALALGVAHIALGKVILGRKPSPAISNYIYRSLQVGVLLLAVGTILGGVWANYSWGRFWDWDPKETWALVALLAYLFILHGRIAGKWAGFGIAVGSVLAFQTIIMAWYGVNFVLGTGLHSYGFGSGGFGYALGFVAFEVGFVALAVARRRAAFGSRAHAGAARELAAKA